MKQNILIKIFIFMIFLSLTLSVCFLFNRNIYDDELGSLRLILEPIPNIWTIANTSGIHPPGMYVISRLFYLLIGSERWMTIGPIIILYIGVGVFSLKTLSHFKSNYRALIVFLLLCLFHPHLLMWGNSIRWYPYWTGLGLVAIVTALTNKKNLNNQVPALLPAPYKCILIGAIIGIMFYINYLTLAYITAFSVAWVVRYPLNKKSIIRLGIIFICYIFIILPQVHPMLNIHFNLENNEPLVSSLLVASSRLFHGVFISDAILPWHPISPVFLLIVVLLPFLFVLKCNFKHIKHEKFGLFFNNNPFWVSLSIFFVLMFLIGSFSGLGSKARSFLILTPIFAFLITFGIQKIKNQYFEYTCIFISILWFVFGYSNLLLKHGTVKAGINDQLEDVVKLLSEKANGKCTFVFLHDIGLTYSINAAKENQQWNICSVYPDHIHGAPKATISEECQPEIVFVIKSFLGSLRNKREPLNRALLEVESIIINPKTEFLSPDKDIKLKKMIPGVRTITKDMPEFRFEIIYGKPKRVVNWNSIAFLFNIIGKEGKEGTK